MLQAALISTFYGVDQSSTLFSAGWENIGQFNNFPVKYAPADLLDVRTNSYLMTSQAFLVSTMSPVKWNDLTCDVESTMKARWSNLLSCISQAFTSSINHTQVAQLRNRSRIKEV